VPSTLGVVKKPQVGTGLTAAIDQYQDITGCE
jgi:hypothetical protein